MNILPISLLHNFYFRSRRSKKDITLYISSPGGLVSGTLAMIDTINHIKCDVSTVCVGMAASGGAWLLSSGTKGKRFILPNAEVMIHQPLGGAQGQTTDILITAEQYRKHRELLAEMMAKIVIKKKEKGNERSRKRLLDGCK